MTTLEPTGERFVPEAMAGELNEAEQQARYRFAMKFVAGRTVLDAGCGVGSGSHLLHLAGAASVTGLDIAAEAIAAATVRAPEVTFVQGDLLALPFPDDAFDAITCFEAIEHVPAAERVLDELQRVLRPDGLLLVSSANPRVDPEGNPAHSTQLTLDELRERCEARWKDVALWRQYGLLASVLAPAAGTPPFQSFHVDAMSVVQLSDSHDPYSLVVASGDSIPEIGPMAILTPSDQLDNMTSEGERVQRASIALQEEAERVAKGSAALAGDAAAVRAERHAVDAEHQRLAAERRRILEEHQRVTEARRVILAERDELHTRLWGGRPAADSALTERLRGELAGSQAERHRLAVLLMQSEQRVARLTADIEGQRLAVEQLLMERPGGRTRAADDQPVSGPH